MPPRPPRAVVIGRQQTGALLALLAMLLVSCAAFAKKSLMERISRFLMLLLVGVVASTVSVLATFAHRHTLLRRQQGHSHACLGCIRIIRRNPAELAGSQDGAGSAQSHQMERSMRSALSALPEKPYHDSGKREESCALCMEDFVDADILRLLGCGHVYHSKCIDRWLITGQAHQRRRCPLCNTDPIETVAVTCPPGARAGDHVRVIHESEYTLTIPAGVGPGQVFHANLPARNAVAMRDCPGVGQTEPSPLPQPLPDSAQALRESDGPSPPSLPASPPGSASGRSHAVAHNSGQGMVDIGSHRESNATTDADGGTVMNWLLQTWRGSTLPAVSARPRGGTDVPRPENASEDGGQRELRA